MGKTKSAATIKRARVQLSGRFHIRWRRTHLLFWSAGGPPHIHVTHAVKGERQNGRRRKLPINPAWCQKFTSSSSSGDNCYGRRKRRRRRRNSLHFPDFNLIHRDFSAEFISRGNCHRRRNKHFWFSTECRSGKDLVQHGGRIQTVDSSLGTTTTGKSPQ